MHQRVRRVAVAIVALGIGAGLTVNGERDDVPPPVRYLGQTLPGTTPVRFAPGIVSTDAVEINGVFRPDFREFFFARHVDGVFTLFRSTLSGATWSAPQPVPIFPGGAPGVAVDMAYSPDGRELYFLGRFKPGVAPIEAPLDIWVTRNRDSRWTTAEVVPAPISTDASESYPTVAADGSLYFSSNRPGGHGRSDIYRAPRRADGSFDAPANLGSPPNSSDGEGDTFVSPDQTYLIVSANRPGGFGRSDLHVSFRAAVGRWGPAINLGPAINTADTDFCPMVTPDGKYLFFSRTYGGGSWATTTDADVFWVDMAVVERLKGGAARGTRPMNSTELTDFATRYAAAWSSQDPARLAGFYAEGGSLAVNDGAASVGRAAIAAKAREFMSAFPDMVVTLKAVEQDGDRATFHWIWTGTNSGPGGTGKRVHIEGHEEWSFTPDGLIAESKGHYDEADYLRQVSVR
jgi:hypothetical protein